VNGLVVCPVCGKNAIGKVGNNQYYCWDCFLEFSIQKSKITVYEVSDDGTLLPYDSNKVSQSLNGGSVP